MASRGKMAAKERRGNEEDEEIYCGMGSCRPGFMQGCASIGCMTAALSLASLSSSTLNIYINSQITTLEKQFGFSSSVSGILLSCNDFGYLLTTLLMSYLARRVHIPRALSVSTLLFGISGLLCTVPFFATKDDLPPIPQYGKENHFLNRTPSVFDNLLCKNGSLGEKWLTGSDNSTSLVPGGKGGDPCEKDGGHRSMAVSEDGKTLAIALIAVGMIFQGFGKSPRHSFVGTYIDDNVPKTKTTLYLGIVSTISIFGPVIAFTLGGFFSKMYITLEETSMSPLDPRWLGAWWLGFLVFGSLGIISSVPIAFFPRRLRPQPQLRMLEQQRKIAAEGQEFRHDFKEFFRTILRLLQTPVYMCIVSGGCVALFGISGMIAFLPKYLETQFLIPAWKANMILGVLNVLAASAGTLAGGLLTSRLKLSPFTCLKVMVAVTSLSGVFVSSGFFLGCDQPDVSMGTSMRPGSIKSANGSSSDWMTSGQMTCAGTCDCDDSHFFPTCGADDVTYFSPCHAGCSESEGIGYGACSCVNGTITPESGMQAVPGFCAPTCSMLYPYAAMNFLGGLTATIVIMPAFVASVRSVAEKDKPLAIGLSAFFSTLFGWFLGPLVYGRIIDTCCVLWSSGCDGSGSCSLYDLPTFRFVYHTAFLCSRLGALLLYVCAIVIAKVKGMPFLPHTDHEDVIRPTFEPEGEKLILGHVGNGGNCDSRNGRELGGKNIYKGSSPLLLHRDQTN